MKTLTRDTFKRQVDLHALLASDGGVPAEIEILQVGMWDTPYHGMFMVTPQDLEQYKAHFDENVRAGNTLPVDYEHHTDGGAAGWITELTIKASSKGDGTDSLWALIEWTPSGLQALKDKVYKFFSPEFCPEYYVDPEDYDNVMSNVLIGGAITTRPLFKSLKPIVASATGSRKAGEDDAAAGAAGAEDRDNIIYFQKGEKIVSKLDEIRKKASSDLTAEDRQVLEANKAELSEEELQRFELNKAADLPTPPAVPAAAPVAASDKGQVTISAGELDKLKADAARGVQAADALETQDLTQIVRASAEKGKILPTQIDAGVKILKASSPAMRKELTEFLDALPENKLVTAGENGSGKTNTTTAADDLDKKASDRAVEKGISYGEALRQLRAEGAQSDDNLTPEKE